MKKLLVVAVAAFFLLSAFNSNKKNKLRLPDEFVFIPEGTMGVIGNPRSAIDDTPAKKNSHWIFLSLKI